MSKIFVGARAQNMDIGAEVANITRVNLIVDSEHTYTAGNDVGRTIEVECPWGTQAMVNSILDRVGGVNYKPFSAERALLDPAFEIGDAVTIGGVYSQIAGADCTYNGASLFGIEAPDLDEIDDEYPAQQTQQSSIKRQLAYTRSLITKTAEEIRLEVEGFDGRISALSVTLNGVTITDGSGQTLIKGSSIDTSTIKANSITADKLVLSGSISWGDLDTDAQNQVTSAQNMAISAYTMGNNASNQVSAWAYPGSTYINGSMIMAGTVMASKLLGGYVGLLNAYQQTLGQIAIGAGSGGYAIELNSTGGGLRLSAATNFWVDAAYGSMGITSSGVVCSVPPVPQNSGNVSLGTYGFKWSQVYAATGTINTSDREEKNSIDYDLEQYDALFDSLKPCSFKMNNGTSGRLHVGMISQDVEVALEETGLTSLDFAGFIKSPKDEGGFAYGLRYTEFIAMNIWQIQQLKARVAELEAKL